MRLRREPDDRNPRIGGTRTGVVAEDGADAGDFVVVQIDSGAL